MGSRAALYVPMTIYHLTGLYPQKRWTGHAIPMTAAYAADLFYQARQNFARSNFDEPSNAFVEQSLIKGEYSQRNSWKKCLQRVMVIMPKVSLTRAFGDLYPGSSALSFTAPSLKASPNTLRSH
jgi:hypothetical protein